MNLKDKSPKEIYAYWERLSFGKEKAKIKDPFRVKFEEFLRQSSCPEIGELYRPIDANRNELPDKEDVLLLLECITAKPKKVGHQHSHNGYLGNGQWTYQTDWYERIAEPEVQLLVFWSMKNQCKQEIACDFGMFFLFFEKINQPHDV